MHGLARLIALAALAAACGDRTDSPRATDGPDGLLRVLAGRRHTAVVPACVPSAAEHDRIVTPPYRGAGAGDPARLREAVVREGAVTVKILYADDATVPASLRRARPAVPVGRPPLVGFIGGAALPALWVFHGGRWRCLVDLDGVVTARLPDAACRTAYERSEHGRCLDFTGALAAAALTADTAARDRLCTLMVEHGCGSVPADDVPVPKQ
ncbi:MAG TPA: hypothetical protein VM261_00880 [Kofleriaceae bacterium]|nr:hypothetical protein [Kofleriaceae bacterium]